MQLRPLSNAEWLMESCALSPKRKMAMSFNVGLAISVIIMAVVVVTVSARVTVVPGYSSKAIIVKKVHGEKVCDEGWECKGFSKYCCNQTISDFFQVYQFEDHFAKRNIPNLGKAVGIWDY